MNANWTIEEHRVGWQFHCVPGEEYPSRYVENEAEVKIGYLGYAKQVHHFEYRRGSFGSRFEVTAAEYDRVDKRRLGPKCKIWISERVRLDIAQAVVLEISEVLLTGALLTYAPHSDLLGLPIKEVMFASTELEELNQQSRN